MPAAMTVQKLELEGDCIILQKLSAESFHSSHPINVINLQPQVVVTVSSLMKGSVIQFLGRVVRSLSDIS